MTHVTSNERVINVARHFTRIGLKRSKFVLTPGQLKINKTEFRFLSIFIQQSSLFPFYAIQYIIRY